MSRWPSRRVWTALAAAFGLAAAVPAARDYPLILELRPATYRESVEFAAAHSDEVDPRPPWARSATSAPEIEVDARAPRARIPGLFPGPADAWAGGTPRTLTLRVGAVPVRRLLLWLHARNTHDQSPPHFSVAVNGAAVAEVQTEPGLPASPHNESMGVRSRYRVAIPPGALGDGANVAVSITSDAGSWILWERIRLAQAQRVFAWAHLTRRERLPRASAALLAASLGAIFLWFAGSARGDSGPRPVLRASTPAATLLLLGLATATQGEAGHALARLPRWSWLALPWALLALRPRGPAAGIADGVAPAARVAGRGVLRSILANGMLSLAGLALALLLAELVLRVVLRDVRSAGDTRTYFHRQAVDERRNSLGFRDREFQLRKPPNVYRIAVLGDSLAFGYSVPSAERFTNRLEQHLARHGRAGVTYEVLNFAWPGWDTVDEVTALRTVALRADPDFVLLQWYVNDFENRDHGGRPEQALPLIPSETLRLGLLRSSALYSVLEPKWVALQEALLLTDIFPAYMYRRFGDPEGSDSRYAIDRIREFIAECRKGKTPLAIVLFPSVGPDLVEGRYAYNYLHNRVLAACGEEGIACVDLRSTFARYTVYRQLWATPLDPHPNPLAHSLATQRLLEALGPVWLEARPRRTGPGIGRPRRVQRG